MMTEQCRLALARFRAPGLTLDPPPRGSGGSDSPVRSHADGACGLPMPLDSRPCKSHGLAFESLEPKTLTHFLAFRLTTGRRRPQPRRPRPAGARLAPG